MSDRRVCLIEDDEVMGGALSLSLELEGYVCDWFKAGRPALAALRTRHYDAVVSDIQLPDLDGEELFINLETEAARPPFIFITGHVAVDQAVRLIKLGAAEYLTKPFEPDALLTKLRDVIRGGAGSEAEPWLGVSPAMRALEASLPRIAQSQATVLITGESGVGKERVAQRLHELSGSTRGPFVAVNCGAVAEGLLESELFGHERGAFTGAERMRKGVFEQAEGGTLLLDEVGDMPISMQIKLLRAIQERQITRVGGHPAIPVNLRLLAATHHDLKARVEAGTFREDLFYRINVLQLRVPPLRERRDDILWLAARFLRENPGLSGQRRVLSPAAERALLEHPWPGNARELRHVIERACVLSPSPVLTPQHLFERADTPPPPPQEPLNHYLAAHEREYILRALDVCAWQIQETAALLGISRKNLWEKMKRLDIRREQQD